MLYRTFCEIDLGQISKIQHSIKQGSKLDKIDLEAVLSTYEGHTIFSIFFDCMRVYEQILLQLQEEEFPLEEDFDGQDCENSKLRRLYRVLNLPTGDLLHSDVPKDPSKDIEEYDPIEEEKPS